MRIALLMAWHEVTSLFKIRTVVVMLIGLPLLLIFLLGNALENPVKTVKIAAYVDESSRIGEAAKQYLEAQVLGEYVSIRTMTSETEVQEDMNSGKADFGFVIPEQAAQADASLGVVHFYPGKNTERNMTANAVLDQFLAEVEFRASAAIVVPKLTEEGLVRTTEAGEIKRGVTVGTLVAGDNVEYGQFSALQYYSVAYLIMFLLYGGMSAAISLSEEREKGTLHRLHAMPVSIYAILFGKLTGVMLFAAIQAVVLVVFTKLVYGVDWGTNYGGIALICMLVTVATVGFAIILSSFIRSRRLLESIFSLIITSMTFVSGGMIANLGQTVREIGKYTINHWANESLRQLMAEDSFRDQWQSIIILTVIATVLLGLSVTRFKKAVALT